VQAATSGSAAREPETALVLALVVALVVQAAVLPSCAKAVQHWLVWARMETKGVGEPATGQAVAS